MKRSVGKPMYQQAADRSNTCAQDHISRCMQSPPSAEPHLVVFSATAQRANSVPDPIAQSEGSNGMEQLRGSMLTSITYM